MIPTRGNSAGPSKSSVTACSPVSLARDRAWSTSSSGSTPGTANRRRLVGHARPGWRVDAHPGHVAVRADRPREQRRRGANRRGAGRPESVKVSKTASHSRPRRPDRSPCRSPVMTSTPGSGARPERLKTVTRWPAARPSATAWKPRKPRRRTPRVVPSWAAPLEYVGCIGSLSRSSGLAQWRLVSGVVEASPRLPDRIPAVWMVIGAILSVQVGAAIAKDLFAVIPPTAMVWMRLATSAVIFLIIARPAIRGRTGRDWADRAGLRGRAGHHELGDLPVLRADPAGHGGDHRVPRPADRGRCSARGGRGTCSGCVLAGAGVAVLGLLAERAHRRRACCSPCWPAPAGPPTSC